MSEVHLHVTGFDEFFHDAETLAERLDAGDRTSSPSLIGFERMETFLKVMTAGRWTLLRRLKEIAPSSIRALAGTLGRDYRGVHSDVAALLELGLIERDPGGKILVPWSKVTAELKLEDAA